MAKFYKTNRHFIYNNLINLPQIIFEVTDLCNLHCKYCGYAELYEGYDKREGKSLSFENVKPIFDYLFKIWKDNYCPGTSYPLTVSFYGRERLMKNTFIILHNIENLKLF